MTLLLSILQIVIGFVYASDGVASWFGYHPPFDWFGSMICGLASIELGICRLLEKWDKAA